VKSCTNRSGLVGLTGSELVKKDVRKERNGKKRMDPEKENQVH